MTRPMTVPDQVVVDRYVPLLTLWRMCQTDDEELARQIKRQAVAEGATALEVARAFRIRDERIAGQVKVIYGGPR